MAEELASHEGIEFDEEDLTTLIDATPRCSHST